MATVAQRRNYRVPSVSSAKALAARWLQSSGAPSGLAFGLPEIDDRYHVWRVPVLTEANARRVGEVVIDARSAEIRAEATTRSTLLHSRLEAAENSGEPSEPLTRSATKKSIEPPLDRILEGDSEEVLRSLPEGCVDLVFTSPPYFNARPQYTEFATYKDYLEKLRRVIREVRRVLAEGRFFVFNAAPVLIRRSQRSQASQRLAVPFDAHRLFLEEGFDFIDDIVWVKPEGAGWATGRGRRFAADRHPLQYKPVPVTEYVLVYRRRTPRLIDWNLRHPADPAAVSASRIEDPYDRTNVWPLKPAHDARHPAIFPVELAEKVIRYYSFRGDLVLDPFAGIGTVGRAAQRLGRHYVLVEREAAYARTMRREAPSWVASG